MARAWWVWGVSGRVKTRQEEVEWTVDELSTVTFHVRSLVLSVWSVCSSKPVFRLNPFELSLQNRVSIDERETRRVKIICGGGEFGRRVCLMLFLDSIFSFLLFLLSKPGGKADIVWLRVLLSIKFGMSLHAALRGCRLQARRSGLAAARRQISSKVAAAAIPRGNATLFSRQLRKPPHIALLTRNRMMFGTDAKKDAKGLKLVLDVDSNNINQVCSC